MAEEARFFRLFYLKIKFSALKTSHLIGVTQLKHKENNGCRSPHEVRVLRQTPLLRAGFCNLGILLFSTTSIPTA